MTSAKVCESDQVWALRGFNPHAHVHILVIPKSHVSSLSDTESMSDHELAACLRAIRIIAEQEHLSEGYRVVPNRGEHACQSVHHLHFHILGGTQMSDRMA